MNTMNKTLLGAALVAAGGLASAPWAQADTILIGLQQTGVNGGTIFTEENSASGSAVYDGAYGSFTTSIDIGNGSPPLTLPTLLTTDSNDIASTSGGTLVIYVTEQGVTTPLGTPELSSGFTLNGVNNLVSGIETTYVTPDDGATSTDGGYLDSTSIELATQSFSAAGGSVTDLDTAPDLTGPYSLTAVYTIDLGTSGNANGTIDISVPEPGSLALFGAALFGLCLIGRTVRRRTRV